MFSDDERDKIRTLGQMANVALERALLNRVEAEKTLSVWIAADKRFTPYDSAKLAARVSACRDNGAKLELDDPALLKGGSPRPLDKATW